MKWWSQNPKRWVVGDGSVATSVPEDMMALLRRAYPSGDFANTSEHARLMEASGMGPRVDGLSHELRRAYGLTPLILPPVEGRICFEIHVTKSLASPVTESTQVPPLEGTRSNEPAPAAQREHVEYVGLGSALVSALGPFASYRSLRRFPRPDRRRLMTMRTRRRECVESLENWASPPFLGRS